MGGSDVNRVRVCRVLAPAGGRGTLVISLICWHAFTKLPSSFYLVLFLHSRLLVHTLPFSDCTLIWRGLFDSRLTAAGNKPASLVFQSVLSHLPALSYCTFKVHAPLSNARIQNSPLSTPSVDNSNCGCTPSLSASSLLVLVHTLQGPSLSIPGTYSSYKESCHNHYLAPASGACLADAHLTPKDNSPRPISGLPFHPNLQHHVHRQRTSANGLVVPSCATTWIAFGLTPVFGHCLSLWGQQLQHDDR